MDGDLILIKLVRNRPILWKRNAISRSGDRDEMQELAWSQVSAKIGTDSDWIKSRWKTLHDCFINAYHSKNGQTRSKFRYYNDMLFSKPAPKTHRPEFIITTRELEESMDDNDNIFEEIASDSDETEQKENADDHEPAMEQLPQLMNDECDSRDESTTNKRRRESMELQSLSSDDPPNEDNEDVDNQPVKKVKQEVPLKDKPTLVEIKREPITVCDPIISRQPIVSDESAKSVKSSTESSQPAAERCEDTIFGELVAAMIKGMPEAKKKQVKKEIMNVLLS